MPRIASKNDADLSGDGARRLVGVEALDLRPTGHPEGTVDVNLPGLLCRILALPDTKGKTWAQHVAEVWIDGALTGNARAIEDIFDRAEKGRPAEASAADAPSPISEQTNSEILEVLSREGRDPASD